MVLRIRTTWGRSELWTGQLFSRLINQNLLVGNKTTPISFEPSPGAPACSHVRNNQLKQQALGARGSWWAIFSSCHDDDREDGGQAGVTDGPEVSMSPHLLHSSQKTQQSCDGWRRETTLPRGQGSLGSGEEPAGRTFWPSVALNPSPWQHRQGL